MALENSNTKNKATKRTLILGVIDGKKPADSTGLVDTRLFTGDNKLNAIMDEQTTLWSMKYDKGGLPEPLKHKYTSFGLLKKAAEQYFLTRNIEIKEVID